MAETLPHKQKSLTNCYLNVKQCSVNHFILKLDSSEHHTYKKYCLTQCHFDDKLQSTAQNNSTQGLTFQRLSQRLCVWILNFIISLWHNSLFFPFFIYSLMKGQESLALLFHSFHLYINQIPCSLQFLHVIPLQILQLHCTVFPSLMRYVLNQRVPSSGYSALSSTMQANIRKEVASETH